MDNILLNVLGTRGLTTAGRLSSALKKLDNEAPCGCLPRAIARALVMMISFARDVAGGASPFRKNYVCKIFQSRLASCGFSFHLIESPLWSTLITDFCNRPYPVISAKMTFHRDSLSLAREGLAIHTRGTMVSQLALGRELQRVIYIIKHTVQSILSATCGIELPTKA